MQNPEGKRVLVVGLARSGRAAADFFRRRGALVTVSDVRPPWAFAEQIPELLERHIGIEFGQHGVGTFLSQDVVVASPGVPWDLPALAAARERGVPVVAEVEAASWFLKGSLLGVTGSNGKTTTTSLIGRMLEASRIPTWVGGNIGRPLVSMIDEVTDDGAVVVELSSFQLEGIECLRPHVAVMLNVTPNHLDRHPSFETYREAKARIFRNQMETDYAVLNADDATIMELANAPGRVRARKVFFSRNSDLPDGVMVSRGQVVYRVRHLERPLFSQRDVRLRGEFNFENVLAATAAACVMGADFEAIARAVHDFRGVEHRLEYVGDVLGVEFFNDSKATSVDATVKALGAFERGVHLILGGKDKGAPYAPLIPLLRNRVREVLLIGAAARRIERELAGAVELAPSGDLETAMRRAFERALPGDVVLLSPACSSYDQFADFEERGRKFKEIVESLAREGEVRQRRRIGFEADRRRLADPLPAPAEASKLKRQLEPTREGTEPISRLSAEPGAVASEGIENACESAPAAQELQPVVAESGAPENAIANDEPHSAVELTERVYVYESEAEERPPLDFEPTDSIDDVELVHDRRSDAPNFDDVLSRPEAPAGDPLIFEISTASDEAPGSAAGVRVGAEASTVRPSRQRKRASSRTKRGADGSEVGAEGTDRLPGL
jgi:UDP-N-acetylmuramoylalanine--D-glutamate ligase